MVEVLTCISLLRDLLLTVSEEEGLESVGDILLSNCTRPWQSVFCIVDTHIGAAEDHSRTTRKPSCAGRSLHMCVVGNDGWPGLETRG